MANAANVIGELRLAFRRIGFTETGANTITDDQGIDTIDELGYLNTSEALSLCKVLRRPGGLIPNNAAGIAAGGPALFTNPGTTVSLRAERNLKLACYLVRHRIRVLHTTTPEDITQPNVRALSGKV